MGPHSPPIVVAVPPSSRPSFWSRIARAVVFIVACSWLASLAAVLYWERRDTAQPASAIVVLGAAQYVGKPSPVLRARLDHALLLWHRQLAPKLVLTGGMGDGDTTSEAAVGRRYVMLHGVPDSAILIEAQGRTTSESVQRVSAIMATQPTRDVILVSDPFHMLRLTILARRYGLRPFTSPTRTSPISASRSESLRYSLSESVKVPLTLLFVRERR